MLIRWSHQTNYTLIGTGNLLRLSIPINCMRAEDNLLIHKVQYDQNMRDIIITAHIQRIPFLSPYVTPALYEPPVQEEELR